MSKFKAKNREEERASDISPEVQEIDTLLEELCEKEEEAKITPEMQINGGVFNKGKQQLRKCGSKQWRQWSKLRNGLRKVME